MGGPVLYGDMGALTTNNFKYGILENQENISADVFKKKACIKEGSPVGLVQCHAEKKQVLKKASSKLKVWYMVQSMKH